MKPELKTPKKLNTARIFSFWTLFLVMGFYVLDHHIFLIIEVQGISNTEILQERWEKPYDVLKIELDNPVLQKETPVYIIPYIPKNPYQIQSPLLYQQNLAKQVVPVEIIFSFIPLSSKFNIPHLNADEEEPPFFV